jgi:thiol-disulfide isomerase/thioredoxin
MNKTILAVSGAGAVGLVVFLLMQFSHVSVEKDGVKVGVGVQAAEAGCYQDGPNCLPPIEFIDVTGAVWTPESLAGKVVVINFWATWCRPCQSEIPDLAKVSRKYKDKDVVILGLMTDHPADSQLKSFQQRYGLDYPVIRVNPELSEAFGHPQALPTNFVYNRTGHLVFDSPGAISAGALEREIKQLL